MEFIRFMIDGNGLDTDIFVNDLNIMPHSDRVTSKKTPTKTKKKTKQKCTNK